jgi:hypothetical protein
MRIDRVPGGTATPALPVIAAVINENRATWFALG